MDAAYLSALSALAGSVVGGMTSGLANWFNLRAQTKAGMYAHELSRREDLYRDFIMAASKAYGEAIMSNEPQMQDLIALYAMISRMRIMSASRTVECADRIMRITMETYRTPNRSVVELEELIKKGADIDPLKEFSEAARDELRAMARGW
jgi:hypothetical protein